MVASSESMDREDIAAVHIQRVVRGFVGRVEAIRRANEVYEKILDPRTKGYYYYNTRTFQTTWKPPTVVTRILGEFGDLDSVAPTYGEDEAAVILQSAWRRRRGARILRALLASVVTKVFDDSTGAYYYFNSLTGETSWSKPALFGSEDVEDYLPGAGNAEQEQENVDPFGTGNYSYEQGDSGPTTQDKKYGNAGHEGWVWDDAFGWYYDEAVAAEQLEQKDAAALQDNEMINGDAESSEGDDSSSDSSDPEEGGSESRKRRRKRRKVAPRIFPRSKAQRLVDEVEDSLEGARPVSLNLSMLDMTRVTSRMYRFDWLEDLNLSSNRLPRVSPDLSGMESLVNLDLRHNRLRTIPDELEALTRLQHLRIGYNRIRGFRGNIYLLSSLQTLDLGHNRIKEVPLEVGDLQLLKRTREWEVGLRLLAELRALDVSYNRLKSWPRQLEGCSKLQDLRMDHNKLSEVPDNLEESTALTSLNLGRNLIKCLPKAVNSLSLLTSLDISHNELEIVEIAAAGTKGRGPRLVSLERLKMENNRLTEGPAAVETFTTLTELDVSDNPISGWKPDFSRSRKMKILKLRGVGLNQCPVGLGKMDKLETLDLSKNGIQALDKAAAGLFKLRQLDLCGNKIKDLGSCVGSMMSLTYLDAGGNGLNVLPPELSRCTGLEHLDVSGGHVDALNEGFSKLTRLRVLRLQNNRITELPASMASLMEIEELRLDGNRLQGLPDSFAKMSKVRFVDLSRNQLTSPPAVTRRWPLLRHLILSRNPLRNRQKQARRLLQAAKRGHEAMHRQDWAEAVRHLNVAAEAYDDAVHVVPDFPDTDEKAGTDRGAPLAQTRPHIMDTFHHQNLGLAHVERARELGSDLRNMRSVVEKDSSSVSGKSSSSESYRTGESAASVSIGTTARRERRQKEQDIMTAREMRDHHLKAAVTAYSYADHVEQLSRPVSRAAGVWLGRAAAFAEADDPASALNDLGNVTTQLRGKSQVRILLAKSRIELGQYERGLTECRVALRCLEQEEKILEKREVEQKRRDEEAAREAEKTATVRKIQERSEAREICAAGITHVGETPAPTAAAPPTERVTTATMVDPAMDGRTGAAENTVVPLAEVGLIPQQADDSSPVAETGRSTLASPSSAAMTQPEEIDMTPSAAADITTSQAQEAESKATIKNGTFSEDNRGSTVATCDGIRKLHTDGDVGTAISGSVSQPSFVSAARTKIALTRGEIQSLILEAEEGLAFVKKSVDMADMLRGFAFTKYGIPVRDMSTDKDGLLQGRSALRAKYKKVLSVEVANKRSRLHDVALMERAMRQASTRLESCRRGKARREAQMQVYREMEEARERQRQEDEAEEEKRNQSMANFERAVKAANPSTLSTSRGGNFLDSENVAAQIITDPSDPSESSTVAVTSTSSENKAVKKANIQPKKTIAEIQGDEYNDDDDDEELSKLLPGRTTRVKKNNVASTAARGGPGSGRGRGRGKTTGRG